MATSPLLLLPILTLFSIRSSVAFDPSGISLPPGYDAISPSPEYLSPLPALYDSSPPLPDPDSPSPSPSPEYGNAPSPDPDLSPSPSPSPSSSPAPSPGAQMLSDVARDGAESVSQSSSDDDGGMSAGRKFGIAFGVVSCLFVVGIGAKVYKTRQENIRRAQFGYTIPRGMRF